MRPLAYFLVMVGLVACGWALMGLIDIVTSPDPDRAQAIPVSVAEEAVPVAQAARPFLAIYGSAPVAQATHPGQCSSAHPPPNAAVIVCVKRTRARPALLPASCEPPPERLPPRLQLQLATLPPPHTSTHIPVLSEGRDRFV